jgi:hypothetical protein
MPGHSRLLSRKFSKDVDTGDKPGHDELWRVIAVSMNDVARGRAGSTCPPTFVTPHRLQ